MPRFVRLIIPLLLLTLVMTKTSAQEILESPPSRLLTSFPFRQFSGGVIVFKAQFENYPDSLNFILDTGSGGISLDSSTCLRLGIQSQMTDKTIRGIAGVRTVRFAFKRQLRIPGLTVDTLDFHINDYDILAEVYGEHIDGIIGYSFLKRYIVKVNFDSSIIQIWSKGSMRYPRGGFLLRPLLISIPIQNLKLREHRQFSGRFYFDMGAGLNMLLSSDYVSDSTIFSSKKKIWNTQAEGLGGKARMKLTTLKEVRLGPYKFRNVPTYIFDDEYNVTSYPYLGGLIGNDLLRRFNVILNYDKRDIFLVPNSHFHEPFDYGYTGLSIYYVNGQIEVTDVMEGSPAEDAGFKAGDVVLSIDNNMSRNIQVYKTMLQGDGGRLKILILRNGVPMEMRLRIRSIR